MTTIRLQHIKFPAMPAIRSGQPGTSRRHGNVSPETALAIKAIRLIRQREKQGLIFVSNTVPDLHQYGGSMSMTFRNANGQEISETITVKKKKKSHKR